MSTTFVDAQKNMRQAYVDGGPAVFASGLVWLVAGITSWLFSMQSGVVVLLVGGMAIHPLGMVLAKLFKRSGRHQKGNPLGQLALESTFVLFIGIFIALVMWHIRPELFFPTMLMVIGSRYLLFATIYGRRIYWGIGAVLAVAGVLCVVLTAPFAFGAFIGGTIEIISACTIIYRGGKS